MQSKFKVVVVLAFAVVSANAANWTPPRTPDGQPDLQGVWTNATLTPLERPAELAAKEFLTPQEAQEYQKRVLERWDRDNRAGGADADLGRAYGSVWWDADARLVPVTRTSLIVDPPEGKLPALTSEAQKRLNDARAERLRRPADGPEDRPLMDRCLWWPAVGPPMLPSFANNSPYSPLVSNYQFLQGPGYVAIVNEILHETRIIPVDGRPHLSNRIRKWMGDSRGRWEGNTLTVDTTNFTAKSQFRGSGEKLHLIERFTRTDEDTILYEFTVNDPATFTRPWSVRVPMIRSQGPIIENACHEGNYGLGFILGIARWEEQRAGGSSRTAVAPIAADLVGTWRLISASTVTAGGKINSAPYGPNPRGFVTYTPDGRMTATISNGGRTPLSVADRVTAPADERAQAFATFLAYAGRYSVAGNKVVHHIEAASIQNWVDQDQVRFFELDGDRLTIRTPSDYSFGGQTQTFTLLLERIK